MEMKKLLVGLIVLVTLLSVPMAVSAIDVAISASITDESYCTPPTSVDLGTLTSNAANADIAGGTFSILWYNPWQVIVGSNNIVSGETYMYQGGTNLQQPLKLAFDGGSYQSINGATTGVSDAAGPFSYPLYWAQPTVWDDNPGAYTVTTYWTCSDST
jgi:hypothetical protein